jgi:hypothetical protein
MINTYAGGTVILQRGVDLQTHFENGTNARAAVKIILLPSGFVQFHDVLDNKMVVVPREMVRIIDRIRIEISPPPPPPAPTPWAR